MGPSLDRDCSIRMLLSPICALPVCLMVRRRSHHLQTRTNFRRRWQPQRPGCISGTLCRKRGHRLRRRSTAGRSDQRWFISKVGLPAPGLIRPRNCSGARPPCVGFCARRCSADRHHKGRFVAHGLCASTDRYWRHHAEPRHGDISVRQGRHSSSLANILGVERSQRHRLHERSHVVRLGHG